MEDKKGLFIVFEGIDGVGKSTQLELLHKHIKKLSKYNEVLDAREPTWRADVIRKRLEEDKDAFSGGEELSRLYVEDRILHSINVIEPMLRQRVFVLCDRYSMSTCAYQWAQGCNLDELLRMHNHVNILKPNVVYYLDVSANVALKRRKYRAKYEKVDLEKFEKDLNFVKELVMKYRALFSMADNDENLFGRVVRIDGERDVGSVAKEIASDFLHIYNTWKTV